MVTLVSTLARREFQTCAKSFSYMYLTYYARNMERQGISKLITIIPSLLGLINCTISNMQPLSQVFAD